MNISLITMVIYMVIYMGYICIYMALMPLRNRSHVKESMVLTIYDHLCIHNYIR